LLALAAAGACTSEPAASAADGAQADAASADAAAPDDAAGSDAVAADAGPLTAPPLASLKVTVAGTRILDALGRQILLRGVNAGGRSKLPPFFPFAFAESGSPEAADAPPFADAAAAYLDRVVTWGHGTLRLPVTWEALEPTRGVYDDVFLDRYAALIGAAGERGLRVIIDVHQDVFARPFCGDGFPLWAVAEPVPPLPAPADCHGWFNGYFTDAAAQGAFDRFWANEDGLQDAFEGLWRHLAARLWPLDAVVGFEILNEPGWGTADADTWASEVLAPFYDRMITVIREVAPGAPIFFDATGLDAVAQATALRRPIGEGLVFAPHFYAGLALVGAGWSGDDDITGMLAAWRAVGDAWQVPVLIGEFGIAHDAKRGADYVRANWDGLDASLLHGTAWEYSTSVLDWNEEGLGLTDPDGGARATTMEAVRPWPAAVAGELTGFTFDGAAATLSWTAVAGGVTEVSVPSLRYPAGVAAAFTTGEGDIAPAGPRLLIRARRAGPAVVRLGPP
jgi:endoglycosylceramidase